MEKGEEKSDNILLSEHVGDVGTIFLRALILCLCSVRNRATGASNCVAETGICKADLNLSML